MEDQASGTGVVANILLVGDAGVGKTSLIQRFAEDECTESTDPGEDVKARTVLVDGQFVTVRLWDAHALTTRHVDGLMLVCDVTNSASFDNIRRWLREASANGVDCAHKMVVGNKCDLAMSRTVGADQLQKLAVELNMPCIETSAKTFDNVQEAFLCMVRGLVGSNRSSRIIRSGERALEERVGGDQAVHAGAGYSRISEECMPPALRTGRFSFFNPPTECLELMCQTEESACRTWLLSSGSSKILHSSKLVAEAVMESKRFCQSARFAPAALFHDRGAGLYIGNGMLICSDGCSVLDVVVLEKSLFCETFLCSQSAAAAFVRYNGPAYDLRHVFGLVFRDDDQERLLGHAIKLHAEVRLEKLMSFFHVTRGAMHDNNTVVREELNLHNLPYAWVYESREFSASSVNY